MFEASQSPFHKCASLFEQQHIKIERIPILFLTFILENSGTIVNFGKTYFNKCPYRIICDLIDIEDSGDIKTGRC